MADLIITSLRGGLNDFDPPSSLPADQCTVAENVEFDEHPLGSRRLGCVTIDQPNLGNTLLFLYRNLPTTDESESQLWALGANSTGVLSHNIPALYYKDTSWHAVTLTDAIDVSGIYAYSMQAATLHGKTFFVYKSAVDRLHVWDGTTVRRTGLAEPAAPTAANTGSGTYIGTRYFRVRYIYQPASAPVLRSEPSDTLTFVPSGSGLSARITKPATISESETHWEIEASTDNANFYRIATQAVGTTTYDDSVDYVSGYATASGAVLSEDIGDYDLLHSAEFVVVDDDRLILGGSLEDEDLASRIRWTPVFSDPGVANDERSPIDTDNFKDLDTSEGGRLTGLSKTVNGYLYAFKWSHIYQLTRSGIRTRAYDAHCLTKVRGAIKGSIVEGLDQNGSPCVYFLDPKVGPCRIGEGGIQTCSMDIINTWRTVNVDAVVPSRSLYYPDARQVHWWLAVDDDDIPSLRIVLQTNFTLQSTDGIRRGWTRHSGLSATALTACLFSENIDDDTARSQTLRPFIGITGGNIFRMDSGITDAGQLYVARIVTAPLKSRGVLNQFAIVAGALVAKAATGVSVVISAIRDFGVQQSDDYTVLLTPTGSEDPVIKQVDNFRLSQLHAVQIEFTDVDPIPAGTWDLDQFAMKPSDQDTA